MRSKATLTLMEQTVMLLVFALAAALCVRIFVYADQTSRRYEARDRAVLEAQNAAEALKRFGGSMEKNYDENWLSAEGDAAYCLTAVYTDSGDPYLWTAEVTVSTAEGEVLFVLPVAGQRQEVSGDA